nr:hypothetical protein [Tanacetum cinerariifolium]
MVMSSVKAEYVAAVGEFRCTATTYDANPPKDDSEERPFKEYKIKFRAIKVELVKIATDEVLINRTPVLKIPFPMAWRILFTFVIQVLGENYSSIEQINSIQQLISYCLITKTKFDIREIIYSDIDEKFVSLPSILSNSNFIKDPSKVTDIKLTALVIAVNDLKTLVSPLAFSGKKKKRKSQTVSQPKPKTHGPEASGQTAHPIDIKRNIQLAVKGFHSPPNQGTRKSQPLVEGKTIDPKDLEGNKHPINKGLTTIIPHKGTNKIKPLLEGSREDKDLERLKPLTNMESQTLPATTLSWDDAEDQEKHEEVAASYADLNSEIKDFHDATYKAHEDTETVLNNYEKLLNSRITLKGMLAKSSTSKAWSLGPKMTNIKLTHAVIQYDVSTLKQDTFEIKSMMTKIFNAFKGQSSSAPSSSVSTTTFVITEGPVTVWRKILLTLPLKNPLLILKGRKLIWILKRQLRKNNPKSLSLLVAPKADRVKGIATNDVELPKKLVKASSKVRPNLNEPVRVPYEIHGKLYHLTNDEIQEHLEKVEKMKKAEKEAKLLAMSKPELKVVHVEASKARIDLKILRGVKCGQEFKKIQDAKIKVLNREHS